MSKYIIDGSTLTGIADAIRAKKGTSAPVAVTDFASEVASIETGGGESDLPVYNGEYVSLGIKLISFTIDGTTYQAVEGMTWADWVADANYNTGGFNFVGGWGDLVHKTSSYYVYNITTNKWASVNNGSDRETAIVANQVYSLEYYANSSTGSND